VVVLTGGEDGLVRVFDGAGCSLLRVVDLGHKKRVRCIAAVPALQTAGTTGSDAAEIPLGMEGALVATADSDGVVRVTSAAAVLGPTVMAAVLTGRGGAEESSASQSVLVATGGG